MRQCKRTLLISPQVFFPETLLPTLTHSNPCMQIKVSEKTPLLSVLLEGENMTGKTALAAHTALSSGIPFVRFIAADALIGRGEMQK